MEDRVEKVEGHVMDIRSDIATLMASTSSAHKRIDHLNDYEIAKLRDARHDHANKIQTHTSMLHGLEISIANLVSTTSVQSAKTGENTEELRDIKVRADTFIIMMRWFFLFCGSVVSGVVFVGGKILHWW